MQFVMESENYTTIRSNIIFASENDGTYPKRPSVLEEDHKQGIAYQELRRSLRDFVRFDSAEGFRHRSLLLVGPPMCGKSSLLLRLCSENPGITVFCLKVEDFVSTDVSLFFSMAEFGLGAIIIIEDLDTMLCRDGRAYPSRRELVLQIKKLFSGSNYQQGSLMVIGESRYPWNLHSGIVNKYFPHRFCMQQPTQRAMEAQDLMRFEFPREWIDEFYLRDLQSYKIEHVKPISQTSRSKLWWLSSLFARLRGW